MVNFLSDRITVQIYGEDNTQESNGSYRYSRLPGDPGAGKL